MGFNILSSCFLLLPAPGSQKSRVYKYHTYSFVMLFCTAMKQLQDKNSTFKLYCQQMAFFFPFGKVCQALWDQK